MAGLVIRTMFFCVFQFSVAHRAGQKEDAQPQQAIEAGVKFFKRIAPNNSSNGSSRMGITGRTVRKALAKSGGQIHGVAQNLSVVLASLSQAENLSSLNASSVPQAGMQVVDGDRIAGTTVLQIQSVTPHYSKFSKPQGAIEPGEQGIALQDLIVLMAVAAVFICVCGCAGAHWWKGRQTMIRKERMTLKPLSVKQLLEEIPSGSEESDNDPQDKPFQSDNESDDDETYDHRPENAGQEKPSKSVPEKPPPTNLSGHLLIVSMLDPASWTPLERDSRSRFVQIRDESLRWWDSKEHFQDVERRGDSECSGFVDFKMNPCEVEIEPGCAAVVTLRPLGGFWVMGSEVLGADLGRPLRFDTSISEHDSSAWTSCLEAQIKNAQVAAASRSVTVWHRNFYASHSLHEQFDEGTRGVVYSCTPKGCLDQHAVKFIDMVETPMSAIQKELDILKGLRHQNIVQIHAAYVERCFVCIVSHKFEASLLGCMQKHWAEHGPIPCTEVVPLQQQILSAIKYVHSQKLVHRDIRCEKLLVNRPLITDPDCHVALSGFHHAMLLADGQRVRQACGSPSYWAPEMYAQDYGYKVDVWAAGVVIFGMIHGFFAFKNKDAVRTQLPYISTDLPEPCQDFLKQMLEKNEQLRPTAKQLLQHPWMSSSQEALNEWTADPPALPENSLQLSKAPAKNFSPARFAYTKWRRSILIERLQKEHRRRTAMSIANASAAPTTPSKLFGSPALLSWRITKSIPVPSNDVFDWCKAEKVEAQLQGADAACAITARDMMGAGNLSRALPHTYTIRRMLEEHKVEVENFNKEAPHRFEDLVKAVQSGSMRLMLDASHYKSLVIVVDIVFLRLQPPLYLQSRGAGTPESREYLVEFSGSHASDGKLPSSCKRAHENTKTTVKRIIGEKIGMSDCGISWETSGEAAEERYESDLYPGIATVYRTEIVDAIVTETDPSILGRCGLPERVDWRLPEHLTQQGGPRPVFRWVSEDACLLQQVKLNTQGSLFTSSLVHAELGGLTDDTLKKQLRAFGVDVSKFGRTGTKSLRDLLGELNSGECVLMQGANSAVLRMVEIVALWLVDKASGKVMARTRINQVSATQATETEEEESGKPKKNKLLRLFSKKRMVGEGADGDEEPKGLPYLPRRPDESLFHTAKRIITEVLGMDEDDIDINPSDIRLGDSEAESEQYPGLRLVYRKHTVIAAYRNGDAPTGDVTQPTATVDMTDKLEESSAKVQERTPSQESPVGALAAQEADDVRKVVETSEAIHDADEVEEAVETSDPTQDADDVEEAVETGAPAQAVDENESTPNATGLGES